MESLASNAAASIGIGAASAAVGGATFRVLHDKAFHLGPEALKRATPGPFIAFGAIGLVVGAANRFDLHLSDRPGLQLAQNAATGAAIFGALTLAAPMFHGTKQPLVVSTLVNMTLGAAVGGAVHLLADRD